MFDKTFLIDIQSTDGTREIIEGIARNSNRRVVTFNCRTQERYQSALMNTFARKAFSEGADWIFFLDADEFLDIQSREQLVDFLRTTDNDVIHMPWINLIPSEYGAFDKFSTDQTYSNIVDV